MITYAEGPIFDSPARVLVNTVNTVGVMGRGIAAQFKKIYPTMFKEYRELCEHHQLQIGTLHLYKTSNKWILNFPTKTTWRRPSELAYIEAGLKKFVDMRAGTGIDSIAFPLLGCGNGQLDWKSQVQPIMEQYLGHMPIQIYIYPGIANERRRPEHEIPDETIKWLQSEPTSLSFSEVWNDLLLALRRNPVFHTSVGKRQFAVSVANEQSPDSATLTIDASGKKYRLHYAELLEFWQQLRSHGYAYRRVLPKRTDISYLAPLFSRLPYVRIVYISDSVDGLAARASTALQIYMPARTASDDIPLFRCDVA